MLVFGHSCCGPLFFDLEERKGKMDTEYHVLEALRAFARFPCKRSDCGTVCLCGSCHARKALPEMERKYRLRQARKRKRRDQNRTD